MENIRIKFSKTGNAKYISHLDLNRFFQRAFKRSGLPIWITEGFNPHIYLHFLLPLSLGTESITEFVDLKITREIDHQKIKERMNEVLPEGFYVSEVFPPESKADKITFCKYEISFPETDKKTLEEFLRAEKIEVLKKTKRKEYIVDLKQEIRDISISEKDEGSEISVILPATENRSINPELIINALSQNIGEEVFARIKRISVLKEDLTEFK